MYTGHVFLKQTGAPLVGVKVSDGRNIALTDENGAFSLPGWERMHVINVGILTKSHDDWYCFAEGEAQTYDFYVTPADECADAHSFFHISDTEIDEWEAGSDEWSYFIRESVAKYSPAFLVHTGDICRKVGLLRHRQEINSLNAGCPVRYTIGNHDFVDENYGEYCYEKYYGPCWYSFDCGNIHYVALPKRSGDAPSAYHNDDNYIWLEKDLAMADPSKQVIIMTHNFCEDENGFTVKAGDHILDLKQNRLLAWCFGHYHVHMSYRINGVFNFCSARPDCGGIDSSPSGIRRVSLDKDGNLTSDFIYNSPEKATPADNGFLWETILPEHVQFSTPIKIEDDVILGTCSDGYPTNCGVFRLDGKNGAVKWSFKTEYAVKNDVVYAYNRLYFQDSHGNLYCVDPKDGHLIARNFSELCRVMNTQSAVTVADGRVFAGCGYYVYAYDAETLSLLWKTERIGGEGSPARFPVYDNLLIVSSNWCKILALDVTNGKTVWQRESPDLFYRSSTPTIHNGTLYVTAWEALLLMDPHTGEILRRREFMPSPGFEVSGAPLFHEGKIFIPTIRKGVIVLDENTLEVVGYLSTGLAKLFTAPYSHGYIQTVEGSVRVYGDTILLTDSAGTLRSYDKNTFTPIHQAFLGAPSLVSPLLLDDKIVTADFNGSVKAFPLKDFLL